jgi:hypothetical protein
MSTGDIYHPDAAAQAQQIFPTLTKMSVSMAHNT